MAGKEQRRKSAQHGATARTEWRLTGFRAKEVDLALDELDPRLVARCVIADLEYGRVLWIRRWDGKFAEDVVKVTAETERAEQVRVRHHVRQSSNSRRSDTRLDDNVDGRVCGDM